MPNMSNNSTETGNLHNPYTLGSAVCCALMLLTTSIGTFGNLITFYIFSRKSMRSSINILLAGLALIDCSLLIFGSAVFVPFGTSSYFYDDHQKFYDSIIPYLTVYFQPLPLISQTASVWTLILITIERFLAVCYPFVAKQFCTIKRAVLALVILIFLAIGYNFCRFWEYKLVVTNGSTSYEEHLKSNQRYQKVYTLYMYFLFMFLIPFLLLCTLNIRIVVGVQRAKMARKRMSRQEKKEQSTTIMMIVIIVIFLVCNILAFVLQILEVWQFRIQQDLFFFLADLSNLLVETNSCVNFLIYFKFSEKYRLQFRLILRNFGIGQVDRGDLHSTIRETSMALHTSRLRTDSSGDLNLSTSRSPMLPRYTKRPLRPEQVRLIKTPISGKKADIVARKRSAEWVTQNSCDNSVVQLARKTSLHSAECPL